MPENGSRQNITWNGIWLMVGVVVTFLLTQIFLTPAIEARLESVEDELTKVADKQDNVREGLVPSILQRLSSLETSTRDPYTGAMAELVNRAMTERIERLEAYCFDPKKSKNR